MESRHTAGPWHVEPIDRFPYGIRVTAGHKCILSQDAPAFSSKQKSRSDCSAGIGFDGDEREVVVCAVAEQEANGRLIAAAPDLLGVCLAVAEHFSHTDAPLGIAARDAIRKALGAA